MSPVSSTSPHRPVAINKRAYLDLLWQFTERNIELRHKGSHLGLIWSLLNPLLMLGMYVFVFGYVFKGRFNSLHPETRVEYALGIFLGLSIFHFFAEVLGIAPSVIISNPNLVKKVVFPLEILPASAVVSALFHGVISLALAILGVAFFGPGLTLYALWVIPVVLSLALLTLGLAWAVSAIGVFFRDIGQVTAFASMALMFCSAVFYPISSIPAYAWAILRFNPLLLAINIIRDVVIWHLSPNYLHIAYVAFSGIVAGLAGRWCFRRLAPAFADVL